LANSNEQYAGVGVGEHLGYLFTALWTLLICFAMPKSKTFAWIVLIAVLAIGAGGYRAVNPLYQLETGVTMALPLDGGGPPWFMIYYIIIALFLGLALIFGRRAGCHTVCWMAPFMILGRWLRNRVRWPSLRLQAAPDKCSDCLTCSRNCPMSLDVNGMVKRANMENDECILCGNCVDGCSKSAIRYTFSAG
jgi:polyferredoxin